MNANNINITFNGNLNNTPGVGGYIYGTNNTTFSATNGSSYFGAQTINGATDFYDLTVSPGTSLQGADLWAAIPELDQLGVPHYTVTDLAHHDHWKHGNLHLMETFCQTSTKPVTCGAGVKTLADLHQLQPLTPSGLDGVVIGHALATGAFSFSDAVAALEARYDPYQWGPAQP